MLRSLYERAASRDGVFSLQDARDCGMTDDQIKYRSSLWRRLCNGVYLAPGAPKTPRAMIRAACLAGAPNAAASHRSAASLYGVLGGKAHIVELTCPRWLRVDHPKLVVHESNRINSDDVRVIDGIPVMRPERALIELASIYKSAPFIEKVLHDMRRNRLVTYDSTLEVFARLAKRGRPGIAITRKVLDKWDPALAPSDSPPEVALVHILEAANVARVVPQLEICDDRGLFIARPDASLPDFRIAVEYESDQEHSDEMSLARDNVRRNRLMAEGWLVVAARKHDLRNGGHEVVAAIRALMRSGADHRGARAV